MTQRVDIWAHLEARPIRREIAARLFDPSASLRLYAGIDSQRTRHLLVSIQDEDDEFTDTRSHGLTVRTELKEFAGEQPRRFVDIECADPAALEMLNTLGNDLARELAHDATTAADAIRKVLSKWRRFWAFPPTKLLSKSELTGLFAELWFVQFWLIPAAGTSSIKRWRGPLGARHDFEWHGTSVEAKATLSHGPRVHTINGIDQLDAPEGGELFLFSQRMREEGGATNSLPILISGLRELLVGDPDALDWLDSGLVIARYHDVHAEEYEKVHFRVVDEFLYRISVDFPRLTKHIFREGMPSTVEKIQYDLNLNGMDRFIAARGPVEAATLIR